MLSRKFLAAAFGAAILAVAGTSLLQAESTWDHTNYLTFSRSVALPGVELAAGTYIFELAMPQSERHLVRVMSRDRHDELLSSLDRHRAGVIYVDNASTDGSVNTYRFQDNFPGNF